MNIIMSTVGVEAIPVTGHIVAAAKAGLPGSLLIACSPHNARPSEWNHSPGKTPCRLTEHGEWGPIKDWRNPSAMTAQDLLRCSEAGANCGLILGVPHGEWQYLFLDLDTEPGIEQGSKDWKIAHAISAKALACLQAALKVPALWVRTTRPGRAGVLLRLPAGADAGRKGVLKMSTGEEQAKRGKIELLAKGQQAIIAGLHVFGNGTPIRWYRTDKPADTHRVPALDEAIPTLADRAQLDAAVDSVVEALKTSGISFSGKSLSQVSAESDKPITELEMMPPSVDMLVDLLDALPHDKRIERDEWVKTMRNVAGCGAALQRADRLSDDDRVRIEDAAIRWSTRWTEGVFSEQEAREKWESDFSRSPNTDVPCWLLLVNAAIALGDQTLQAESLRLRADEIEADFEATEAAPEDWGVAVHASEDAIALAFACKHVGQLAHVAALGGWYRWSGSKWAEGAKPAAFTLAREVCRSQAKSLSDKDDGLARKVSSASTVAAVLTLAAADPRFARLPGDFDDNDWALNTPAGIIDLQSGSARSHRLGERVMKCTSVAAGGNCPRWLRFLSEITRNDYEVVAYLQRWAGYMLTGSTREHAFLFLHGPGGNGKSVLIDTLAALLGDYATPAMSSVFTATRNEAHPTETAALRGARLVTVGETDEGGAWAEARLKSLTGGDRIAARISRGDPFAFQPKFKLAVAGNHRPVLRNVDAAMRRRLHLLPLTFVPAVPDQSLPEALRGELDGILAWAIDGCLQWQRNGLDAPRLVREASDAYFAEADVLKAWLDERCTREPSSSESSSALFADFASFVAARKEAPRTAMWFSVAMERHFVRRRTKAGMVFDGVVLRPLENDFGV